VRRRKEDAAKAICAQCAVFEVVRRFAIEAEELYGGLQAVSAAADLVVVVRTAGRA